MNFQYFPLIIILKYLNLSNKIFNFIFNYINFLQFLYQLNLFLTNK